AGSGKGPSLIEAKFHRLSAHGNAITVPPVPTQFPEHEAVEVYGKKSEFAAAVKNDPIPRFRASLVGKGILKKEDVSRIEEGAGAEMEGAVQFALASPLPSGTEAVKHVYA